MNESAPKIYIYKRIVQAKLFIDTNFAECLDLENIAGEAYFSKFHFIRLFRNIYGFTPHQYLTKVRIEKAKLLLEQHVSVADACYRVGFDSITSFSGLFKRHTRFSPSQYQLQYQKRKQQIRNAPLSFIPNCFAYQNGWTEKSNFQEVI